MYTLKGATTWLAYQITQAVDDLFHISLKSITSGLDKKTAAEITQQIAHIAHWTELPPTQVASILKTYIPFDLRKPDLTAQNRGDRIAAYHDLCHNVANIHASNNSIVDHIAGTRYRTVLQQERLILVARTTTPNPM